MHPRKKTIKELEKNGFIFKRHRASYDRNFNPNTKQIISVKRHDFNENDMQYTYTAVITEKDGTFYAKVPDVDGCITTAPTLTEAIALITDALNLCLVGLEDEEITPNEPTPQAEIPHLPTDILTIIQADTIKYRSMTDTKAVRKNVSLPAWMSKLADKRGINCSKVLQEALTTKLL